MSCKCIQIKVVMNVKFSIVYCFLLRYCPKNIAIKDVNAENRMKRHVREGMRAQNSFFNIFHKYIDDGHGKVLTFF